MKRDFKAHSLGIAVTLLAAALMFITSGFVGVFTENVRSYERVYLVLGALLLAVSLLIIRSVQSQAPSLIRLKSILPFSFLALIGFLGLTYLALWLSDAFGAWDDILLEAVSTVTATNLSVTTNPESLDQSVLIFRALGQWVSGFGAFVFFGVFLPLFIKSKEERRERVVHRGSVQVLTSTTFSNFLIVLKIYLLLSVGIVVGYYVAGMSLFDAVTHGFTTVSTGGFSNYSDGLAHFDSVSVEWVAAIAMLFVGIRPALLWWGTRGWTGNLWRSLEMRIYVSLVAIATLILLLGDGDGLRRSFFSVTSAISGTGFYLGNWSALSFGLQAMLIILIATGAMKGTASGGFGLTRAIITVRYIYRELLAQLHPNVIFRIKVDKEVLGENGLSQIQSLQFFFVGYIMLGAFVLAQLGVDITSAIGGSISALTTMGPSIGEAFSDPAGIETLSRPARGVLMVLMFVGRISVFSVMLLMFSVGERAMSAMRYRLPID